MNGSASNGLGSDLATLMRTVDFAARKHATQRRKDVEQTPYMCVCPLSKVSMLAS